MKSVYFFVLGSNPALSLAELAARFGEDNLTLAREQIALCHTEETLEARVLIRQLGGTIKIGRMLAEAKPKKDELFAAIAPLLKPAAGKYHFGFSGYGASPALIKPLAMTVKKELQSRGVSARWVVSREQTLSSVVVEQNKLLDGGAEFVLVSQAGKLLVGQTLAVQPFKELSRRDYGRPSRDDLSGMLPPKLAQIMINLSRAPQDGQLLDPFCGSGTILTEAALMGYQNLLGADVSAKAIEDTKKNFEWMEKNFKFQISNFKLKILSAIELSKNIDKNSIDAIVTEPYLGPQRGRVDTRQAVSELETLYQKSLIEFYKILKPGARVVMIWPIFNTPGGRILLSQKIADNFKIIPPFVKLEQKLAGLSGRQTIVYGRPGQKVWREIVVLEK